jgi:predicted metal-dependent phosphotriesterase family hydrolase
MKTGSIVTVTGEILPDQLGPTLIHEHLWCDFSIHSGKKDNLIADVALIVDELKYFRGVGGRSIVEVTPVGVGRDPAKLNAISLATGLHVISGIGFYDVSTYPNWVRGASEDDIVEYFVYELEEGSQGERAGLIGELWSHNEANPNASSYKLHTLESKVFRAAARVQKRTGAAISTHASLGRAGHAQLDILEQAGADLSKVAIGHCDAHWHEDPNKDMEYYLPILDRGAYCAFDLIGWIELMPDEIRARRIASLIELGYERQILLSSDICRLSQLHKNGGRGFDYLWTSFFPCLHELGVTDSQINSMVLEAPKTFLVK